MEMKTLKLNKEFKRLYYRGCFKSHPLLVTYLCRNNKKENRIGITTGKKVGRAVDRSRARRVIRAAWRQVSPSFPIGYDFVFVARMATPAAKSDQIARVMKGQVLSLLEANNRKVRK